MSGLSKREQFLDETFNSFDVEHVGHVYCLGSSLGYYKIGYTTNLYRRFTDFGVKLPFDVWLEYCKIYYDCAWGERYWHLSFEDKRVNGEWFKLNEIDLDRFYYTPDDVRADAKFNAIYFNSNIASWKTDNAGGFLKDYHLRIARIKEALFEYYNKSLAQPEITRQYLVRKRAQIEALSNSPKFEG